METLAYSIDHEPVISSIKSNSFSKSLTAIYILQSSLNFDEGREIAENLYRIYEFAKDGNYERFYKKKFKSLFMMQYHQSMKSWMDGNKLNNITIDLATKKYIYHIY